MRNVIFVLLIFYNLSAFSQVEIPYIIYTTAEFEEAANLIEELHKELIPNTLNLSPLDTDIIYTHQKDQAALIDFLLLSSGVRKYMLIIGDESIISSVRSLSINNGVISLKFIPAFGKSGTFRIALSNLSLIMSL